ncbi:MAG: ATP-binding cassette domain-containing protein [Anaerolineae bacterium]|nr:ATP-binding cassette domain-containing protein [Anaerolineae bacterium]
MNKIVKTFKNAAGEFTVLKGVNTSFSRGEFVGVIGKSGSGKSTLINMITGIDRPTSGEVFIGGVPIHTLNENQMSVWRGRNLGIVFQFFQLLPTLSLVENIMLPMDFCHMYEPGERYDRAMSLLRLVEMDQHAEKLPTAISGGQQQRVAIARSLANDPPILVADEPTGNLDSKTADAIFGMFEDLVSKGKTIVMVTHDSSLAKRVTRTVLIADGEIVNEWVAKALPTLTHQQMLAASKQVEPRRFEAGEVLIQQGQASENVYIVTQGEVEISAQPAKGGEEVLSRIGAGQMVGEMEALKNRLATATVRANGKAVEVLAMPREKFLRLIGESEGTRQAMEHLVRQRESERLRPVLAY